MTHISPNNCAIPGPLLKLSIVYQIIDNLPLVPISFRYLKDNISITLSLCSNHQHLRVRIPANNVMVKTDRYPMVVLLLYNHSVDQIAGRGPAMKYPF